MTMAIFIVLTLWHVFDYATRRRTESRLRRAWIDACEQAMECRLEAQRLDGLCRLNGIDPGPPKDFRVPAITPFPGPTGVAGAGVPMIGAAQRDLSGCAESSLNLTQP